MRVSLHLAFSACKEARGREEMGVRSMFLGWTKDALH